MRRRRTKAEEVRESLVFYQRTTAANPPLADICVPNCSCPDSTTNEATTAAYIVGTA